MDLPHFYITETPVVGSQIALSEESSRHCIQVLRMKSDEPLMLTNGKGSIFRGSITKEDKRNCLVSINHTEQITIPARRITIAISLVKNASRFEWFLEKATELGVTAIIPLLCDRTEKQYFRQDRMNNIVVSAMLQSKQAFLPTLSAPISFGQFISNNAITKNFIAHCVEDQKQSLSQFNLEGESCILIGPEGDFSREEIDIALQHNYHPISLGNTRLRTETAGIVAATLAINLP